MIKFIASVFGYPLGFLMLGCYLITGNHYALAIAVFTLVTRLLLLPLAIHQQKKSLKIKLLKVKAGVLKEKYKDNEEKCSEEIKKLYAKEKYNPAYGNTASYLQIPILLGIFDCIRKPLFHIFRVGAEQIAEMEAVATAAGFDLGAGQIQPKLIEAIKEMPEAFSAFDQGLIQKIIAFDMDLFGLNLSVVPKLAFTVDGSFNWYLVIPLICLGLHLVRGIPTIKKAFSGKYNKATGVLMGLNLALPVISFCFCFLLPTGVGLYWVISNIFSMIQTAILNAVYNPKKYADAVKAEFEAELEAEKNAKPEETESDQQSVAKMVTEA